MTTLSMDPTSSSARLRLRSMADVLISTGAVLAVSWATSWLLDKLVLSASWRSSSSLGYAVRMPNELQKVDPIVPADYRAPYARLDACG